MFECNVDIRGRIIRLALGFLLLVVAYKSRGYEYPVWVQMGLVIGGSFVLFEGTRGWCALKALGFRVPF